MAKYVVIAGAAPALHRSEKGTKGEIITKTLKCGDVLDESYFNAGEIGEQTKQGFIEEYKPHTLTIADLKANPQLEKHDGLKEGDEIRANKPGFKPAEKNDSISEKKSK